MRKLRSWFFRFGGLFRQKQRDSELADEIESNLQMHIEDNIRAGMSLEAARRDALIKLGGVEVVKEKYRDRRGIPLLETLTQDLRYAARTLRRSPGFTFTALVSLALGIGSNSAIFTAANAVLWRTLKVSDPQSLVLLTTISREGGESDSLPTSFAEDLGRSSGVLSSVITRNDDGLSLTINGGRAERIIGEVVSPNYFEFFGVKPLLGRAFSDEVQNGHWSPEVVLSYQFWQRRFGGDPKILGQTIRLNDYPFTIVGVRPAEFYGEVVGFNSELCFPLMPAGQKLDQMRLAYHPAGQITARLKPGINIKQAEAACDTLFQQYIHDHPSNEWKNGAASHLKLTPGDKGWQGGLKPFREPLFMLLGLAGLVLLIACTNLANMLIARGAARQRELAIRTAIGAGRARLVRQMVVESLLLAAMGGGLGLAAAAWAENIIFAFFPQGHISIALDLTPDLRVLWFTIALALLTGVLSGLAAALRSTRGDLAGTLRSDSAASIGSTGGARFRKALVVGQIAISLLSLAIAGLFIRSLGKLKSGDQFPTPDRVLLFTLKPQPELYNDEKVATLIAEIQRRMAALPGVRSAGLANNGPLGSRRDISAVRTFKGETVEATYDRVSLGYFDVIGLPLISGRDFNSADSRFSKPVVVINEVLSRRLFNSENPIGKKLEVAGDGAIPHEIIGVVRNTRYYDLHVDPMPAVFVHTQQAGAYMPTLHVRAISGNVAEVMAAVRREFDAIDKDIPVFNVKTLQDRVNDSLARERLIGDLAGSFGLLALALAIVGVYGIMAYSVTERRREIGVRMALGATPWSVLKMVLKESALLVTAGIAFGVPATLAFSRLISSQLSGVTAVDPLALVAAVLTMAVMAVLAGLIPALRAARIDPQFALRN